MKRWMALALSFIIVISLFTGCKKSDQNEPQERPEFTYTSVYSQVQTEDESITNFSYSGRRVYYISHISIYDDWIDEETGEYRSEDNSVYHINSMSIEGTDYKTVAEFKPSPVEEGWNGTNSVSRFVAGADGFWVVEQALISRYNIPEGLTEEDVSDRMWDYYESKETYTLTKLEFDGDRLLTLDVKELLAQSGDSGDGEGYLYISDINVDALDNLYIFAGEKILVLSKSGDLLCLIKSDGWINSTVKTRDGKIAVVNNREEGLTLSVIDVAAKKIAEPETYPSISSDRLYTGSGDYDFFYSSSLNFMGLKLETGESSLLFNFINCDVDADYIDNLITTDDGTVLAISTQYEDGGEVTGMYRIYSVRTENLPQKTNLTYACMGLDGNVRKEIVKFNRSSQKYRIEVVDYSQYVSNGENAYENALKKLTTELLAGKVPDMFATSNMPIRQLGAKGYLEDLWPYIERTCGRSGVVEPFFNALSGDDGKLYQLSPTFKVVTVAGSSDVVGKKMGWSMAELMRAYKSLWAEARVFSVEYTKSKALEDVSSIMLDGFVNWDTGEVSFNSENFIHILEFANLFPATFDEERYWREHQGMDEFPGSNAFLEGYQLLETVTVSDFINWRSTEQMVGGDLTFVGYPVETGVGSAFDTELGIAMSATCADKEGAWEFMSRFLDDGYQYNAASSGSGFPSNKAMFDRCLKEAQIAVYERDERGSFILDDDGQKIEVPKGWGYSPDGMGARIYHLTEEQAAKVNDLVYATTRLYGFDQAIYEIIVDRASAYFSGQQTSEAAAKAINSRVFLYVNEQR